MPYVIFAVEYLDRHGKWQFIAAYYKREEAERNKASWNLVTHYVEGTTKENRGRRYRVAKYERCKP